MACDEARTDLVFPLIPRFLLISLFDVTLSCIRNIDIRLSGEKIQIKMMIATNMGDII